MAAKLPENDTILQEMLIAGFKEVEIAKFYGVGVSTVSMRLAKMGIRRIGPKSPVSAAIPWDITSHPEKRRFINQTCFRGLRCFVRKQMGEKLSERSEHDLKVFLNRIRGGNVLALVEGGFAYVPRQESDGSLVIRWPENVPHNAHVALFDCGAHQAK
ncbi:hypothetical protein [Streptomyces sp. NPDC006446]|uniref:hypothetical protein n=1 Tax=Streptomyces sp. NPDC006446 TaxID=3154301 RepID=UPI0033ACE84E